MTTLQRGSTADRISERDFQRSVMHLAELSGWETLHVRTSMQQGRYLTATTGTMAKGFPDLLLVKRRRIIFAELKGNRGRLRPDQERVLNTLSEAESDPPGGPHIEVVVWRPNDWGAIEETLR